MKKILLSLIIVATLITTVHAQVNEATFRLYGGLNLPKYSYDNNGNTGTRDMYAGANAGLMLSVYAKTKHSVGGHFALNYSQKGAINNTPGTGYSKAQNRLTYLQVDAMGSYGLGKNRSKGSFADILVGFYFGRIVKAEQKLTANNGNTASSNFNIGTNTSDDFIKYDVGLKGGLLFTISSKWMVMGLYEYGISDIAPSSNVKISNRNIQLSVGYNFGYKRR
jgi:Outer membrane protein beta-barrel domain